MNRDVHTNEEIEIELEGSCLGATVKTGWLIVRDVVAKSHSFVVSEITIGEDAADIPSALNQGQ